MQDQLFYKIGLNIAKNKGIAIFIWLVIIFATIPFLPDLMTPFNSTGFVATDSKSDKADKFLKDHLKYYHNRFILIYSSEKLKADSSTFKNKIKKSLEDLDDFELDNMVIYPSKDNGQISEDKKSAFAVILLKDNKPIKTKQFEELEKKVKTPEDMTLTWGGESIFIDNVNEQTHKDIYKADIIAAPVSIVILIFVFGTIVAACVPVILGGGCALVILTSLYLLAQAFDLSIFTLNIALLLGLCLCLDYSLFIVKRFRDELRHSKSIEKTVAIAMATAGRAVFYSGLTVFISLSALLMFPVNILFSLGVGGLVAVGYAVAITITLLPAVLALLNTKINSLSIYPEKSKKEEVHMPRFWLKLAQIVVRRPMFFFLFTLALLLGMGAPFLNVKFGISDYQILPTDSEGRKFYNLYEEHFDVNELSPIKMIIKARKGDILDKKNLEEVYDTVKKIQDMEGVEKVDSIVSTKPKLSKNQYVQLYKRSLKDLNKDTRKLLESTTNEDFTVVSIVSKHHANSTETRDLIDELKELDPGCDMKYEFTGVPVNNDDVLEAIWEWFPTALIWIMGLTYLVLLMLLRSVFLPLKAILMNILSLVASYGVLVFVFQEGHLHELLNFDPQDMLDVSLLVIIFCALFGFSMDYEVFLLSRVQEYYQKTNDNKLSIIFGIVKSSRVITSAALIVIFLCGSFMVADVLMVKAFGLGIAVAIFVDAFIIRTLFVPATMVLVSSINWYLPEWLDNVLPGKSNNKRKLKNH